ncbi:substrate-binding domain-containing protein [Secundilactobacillus kimchicus]|uniref:substrate-binding domain-containing protein n=1 Tax=Secundilactobacillus kimchicus TaxID=528209 RepID=UPI000A83EE5D|nr:substrate-binding domain-containing protein [Secundilactobacillus kimchicus]
MLVSTFFNQAKQIISLSDKTIVNIQQSAELSGIVTIGSAEASMMVTVAETVAALKQKAPKVKVNLYSTDADEVTTKMDAGLFDFGVVMEPADKENANFLTLPGSTQWGLLVRRDNPLTQQATVSAADLQKQCLIMPQQTGNLSLFANWIGDSTASLEVISTYNLLYNASIMAATGVGAVLCLDGIINTTGSNLTFIPLAPRLEAHASLIWSKSTPLSAQADAFLKEFRQHLASQ